jgi:hypothetical protein
VIYEIGGMGCCCDRKKRARAAAPPKRRRALAAGMAGFFTGPGLTAAATPAAFAPAIAAAAKAFESPLMTSAALYKAIVPELDRADKILAIAKTLKEKDNVARLPALTAAVAQLRAIRNAVKLRYNAAPNGLDPDAPAAKAAVTTILSWVSGVAAGQLTKSEAHVAAVKDLYTAPAKGLRWLLEQPLAALGLPPWILPVGALAVAGVYLAPAVMRAIGSSRSALKGT